MKEFFYKGRKYTAVTEIFPATAPSREGEATSVRCRGCSMRAVRQKFEERADDLMRDPCIDFRKAVNVSCESPPQIFVADTPDDLAYYASEKLEAK